MHAVNVLAPNLIAQFREAVLELEAVFTDDRLDDQNVEHELRSWLDGDARPLTWTHNDRVTEDEWFFVTTLYGEMTLAGQRTHIRRFFEALFVRGANRDIRNFRRGMAEFVGLRSAWMATRLCRMAEILREQRSSMADYSLQLRRLEATASPEDPMPALDRIIVDHRATGWKTLSVFVRDCVGGNSFPIDTRVERVLKHNCLPVDERCLVRLSLAIGRNPRRVARMFYEAGGQRAPVPAEKRPETVISKNGGLTGWTNAALVINEVGKELQAKYGAAGIPAQEIRRLAARVGGYGIDSLYASDYCYNVINRASSSFTHPIFERVGHGLYRYLGPSYVYDGPVLWKPIGEPERQVGSWQAGVPKLTEDPRT